MRSRHLSAATIPEGGLFAHAIGYSYTNLGRAGLEQSRNDELTGRNDEITSVLDELRGKQREGADVTTTLDPKAQRVAIDALSRAENGKGAVVALDPQTGAVRVMASTPGYDPNSLRQTASRAQPRQGSPVFNRATQAGYPPARR